MIEGDESVSEVLGGLFDQIQREDGRVCAGAHRRHVYGQEAAGEEGRVDATEVSQHILEDFEAFMKGLRVGGIIFLSFAFGRTAARPATFRSHRRHSSDAEEDDDSGVMNNGDD